MPEYNGDLLKRARMVRGWGIGQMAARIRKDPRTVSRIEKGQTGKPETVKDMADALGLKMEDVVL